MIGDVIEIVKDIVEGLGESIPFSSASAVNDTTSRVRVGNRINLLVQDSLVSIGNDTFLILAIRCEQGTIDLQSTNEDTPVLLSGSGTFEIEQPLHFYHGTMNEVSGELDTVQDLSEKLPFVWFVERTSSDLSLVLTERIAENTPVRLLFLTADKRDTQKTPAIYDSVIRPMEVYAKEVIEAFRRSPLIGKLSTAREISHVRAGTYTEKEVTKNYFNHNFSGVELSITLPIVRQRCNC